MVAGATGGFPSRPFASSDATAARRLEEHVASLNSLALFFADVMTVEEALQRIARLDAQIAMPEAPVRV